MKGTKYLVLFSLFAMNLVDQPAPEVEIDSGVLSGRISPDGDILEYVGIPYATAERFQAPKPPPKWKGVFNAIDGSYQCPQPTPIGIVGTEDCLKINVYVPAKAKIKSLPVMFYVHGGAFFLGSGGKILLGPDLLLKHDVILVTFNYRLGALGFLCLGIKEAPGNAGLKDQIAALKWVQRNIAAFGGDPDNVTIFGHSAGGTSVSLLLASEATNGLFKKVIVQSGSALTSWATNSEPIEIAKSIAKQLSVETDDPLELYEFYKNAPFEELIKSTANIPISKLLTLNLLHLPCVEKKFPGIEPAISDLPYKVVNKNRKNISVIYGSTDKEGLFFISDETEESLKNINVKQLFGNHLVFENETEANQISEKVKEFYFGTKGISYKTIMNLSDIYSHLYFEVPAILESKIMKRKAQAPIYNYYFTYSGGRNMVKERTGFRNVSGACHGDDILYLFNAFIWPYKIKAKDQITVDWMTKMWTNFAKFGDPTPDQDNDLPVKWEPSNTNKWNFLNIGDELKMGPLPNPDSYKLWEDIYEKYRN